MGNKEHDIAMSEQWHRTQVEALRAERDAAVAQLESWRRALDQLVEARDAVRAQLATVAAEVERLRGALGLDTPWPVTDVLARLVGAVNHLRAHHCDCHGHEEVAAAMEAGARIMGEVEGMLSASARPAPSAAAQEALIRDPGFLAVYGGPPEGMICGSKLTEDGKRCVRAAGHRGDHHSSSIRYCPVGGANDYCQRERCLTVGCEAMEPAPPPDADREARAPACPSHCSLPDTGDVALCPCDPGDCWRCDALRFRAPAAQPESGREGLESAIHEAQAVLGQIIYETRAHGPLTLGGSINATATAGLVEVIKRARAARPTKPAPDRGRKR